MVVVVIFFLNKSWIINDVNSLKKGQEISLHTLLEEKKKKKPAAHHLTHGSHCSHREISLARGLFKSCIEIFSSPRCRLVWEISLMTLRFGGGRPMAIKDYDGDQKPLSIKSLAKNCSWNGLKIGDISLLKGTHQDRCQEENVNPNQQAPPSPSIPRCLPCSGSGGWGWERASVEHAVQHSQAEIPEASYF